MKFHQQYEITESAAAILPLSHEQAAALRSIGQRLAKQGSELQDNSDRSIIDCSTNDGLTWRVQVMNAVGLIGLPDGVQIKVKPKIPIEHLLYLLELGGTTPRTTRSRIEHNANPDLHSLVATWFLDSVESLLRRGIDRAFVLRKDQQPMVRGRIDAPQTMLDISRGRLRISCEYEDYIENTPLNRVLAAAIKRIARSNLMPHSHRKRARQALSFLHNVGSLQASDLRTDPDRVTARYSEAISLARLLLAGQGVGLPQGAHGGSSFLLPTPLAIEEALRSIVSDALATVSEVDKGRLTLVGSEMTVNPDLVIGDLAVGDIKYKVWNGTWIRTDLYQLVTFATAFERRFALHVGFGRMPSDAPLRIGNMELSRVVWNTDPDMGPEKSAASLQNQIRTWWGMVSKSQNGTI